MLRQGVWYPDLEARTMISTAESALVQRLQAKDEVACEELLRVYLPSIYRVTCRMLRDPEEAAEVTVDAFVRLYRSVGHYGGECSLRTWVFKIAFSEIRSPLAWLRRRCRRSVRPTDDALPAEVEPQMMVCEEAIRGALQKLPRRRRSVVILRDIEGCSYKEIGQHPRDLNRRCKVASREGTGRTREGLDASPVGWAGRLKRRCPSLRRRDEGPDSDRHPI